MTSTQNTKPLPPLACPHGIGRAYCPKCNMGDMSKALDRLRAGAR